MPEPIFKSELAIYDMQTDPYTVYGQIYEEDHFVVWDKDGETYDASYDLDSYEDGPWGFTYYSPIKMDQVKIVAPKFWAKMPYFEDINKEDQ